jgi:hypothetical protein
MKDWIFLSKGGIDPYINRFCEGSNGRLVDSDTFVYEEQDDGNPIVLRGILKKKIIHKCWKKKRPFYYMDTGYFGNEKTSSNPHAWKYWHRVVKDDLQHGSTIIERSDTRFKQFGKKFHPWKKDGRKILIAKPDEKPMRFYDLNLEEWLQQTIETIKMYTDRPIVVRERNPLRANRIATDTLQDALNDDVFALVTFNSIAAVESVFYGIPAFTLAPTHAAAPVTSNDLTRIDNPLYPDHELLYAWACHLAHGQFHVSELKSGKARAMLEEL